MTVSIAPGIVVIVVVVTAASRVDAVKIAPDFVTVDVVVVVPPGTVEVQGGPGTVVVVVVVTELGAAVIEQGAAGTVVVVVVVKVGCGIVVEHGAAGTVVVCVCTAPDTTTVFVTSCRLMSELQNEVAVRATRIDSHSATLSRRSIGLGTAGLADVELSNNTKALRTEFLSDTIENVLS